MTRTHRVLIAVLVAVPALALTAAGGVYWRISNPTDADLTLPPPALAANRPEGLALIRASASADHDVLLKSWERQDKGSWCGVASSVAVLGALGHETTQSGFFEGEAGQVRSFWATTFGGMPITDLERMVEAHGVEATVVHASESSADAFRAELQRNTRDPSDFVIVNYDRSVLGQEGTGHISPVSAISPDGRQVLILDTASYKYPFHWVPLDTLFAAMDTPDSETGASRGWVVVR